ncbi:hypothetical protein CEXT_169091 [Caerostris extrusa]|uniref:Uncharacterized protein n=1 Tax=Caerostris extrusa TaxID=172846 RepID=A0AAV4S1Q4_CAEEX|nr:hypothetical protein CEXT_169091 [Caerostris extrusa]
MRSAATDCNVESDPMVEDILSIYNFTCTEDTEMNTLYKKHKDCIVGKKSTSGTRDCLKPFSDATISPIGIPARSLVKRV